MLKQCLPDVRIILAYREEPMASFLKSPYDLKMFDTPNPHPAPFSPHLTASVRLLCPQWAGISEMPNDLHLQQKHTRYISTLWKL